MARKIYEESKIAEIAKRIREKTGGATTYTTAEMADGVSEVYEAGKKSEYDAFWDEFQDYGNRTDCQNMFYGSGWTNAIYKPKHPLHPTNAYAMYQRTGITDIYCGGNTIVDFSKCTDLYYTFYGTHIEHLGVLDFSSGTRMTTCFAGSAWLVSIDKLIISESMTSIVQAFTNTQSLVDVTIEGVIPVSVDIQKAPLSYDSIVSFISHLSDTATGQTLTLSKAAVNKAFATGTATYRFNDDDAELKIFLANENVMIYDVNFVSNGESFVSLIANDPSTMLYSIDGDASTTAYQNGWANEAYKTITVADSSTIPVDFMSHLIKMAKRTSHVSTLENGSASPEWLAFVASKPNWTITLV